MTDIGKHLLGRVPSPIDERDWTVGRLREKRVIGPDLEVERRREEVTSVGVDQLPAPTSLQEAFSRLLASHAAQATKDWARFAQPLLEALAPPQAPVAVWADTEAVLDQGNFGTCVGNGWAQWGNTLPVDDRLDETAARAIYFAATKYDGQPDDPDSPGGGQQGSTVRSGAKAVKDLGHLTAYAFAASLQEVIDWLKTDGPVVMGTDWYSDMFSPVNGYVSPTGTIEGGHCYVAVGYLPDEDAIVFINSWGAGWGDNGRFKMKTGHVGALLNTGGEACVALEVR